MLLRCLGWRKRKRDDHTLLYADALAKTASESIEAIVRKRRILFAGFVARVGEGRPPQRIMFEELVGGKGYAGGQEKDWEGGGGERRGEGVKGVVLPKRLKPGSGHHGPEACGPSNGRHKLS